ncbi:uncharacterized protein LOC117171183 [Belonocnema kinseyi]|uniref:uncharacterized protein LOC117171183 n=1 Tax=Belonocnema kinseyi TaxID=2817044 RepID=UPI00143D9D78|nr:uncharacterized protein LOC117171183 [Belonocnema kinseyi]XP_033214146.1 uncharacterized protein LOC117171183 [Belonocnema kinseyi]XP_033214147.1 uncharacterized protein LOC117171183 [Belonocnema kinseyi]
MDDSSTYEGVFTGSCTGDNIPEWMQPNGSHNTQQVMGFIRTEDYKQSQTSRLKFRDGPANHHVSQHAPARSVINFDNKQLYNVISFDRYIPNREHRPPGQLYFPLHEHFYVVVPGGHVYRGLLLKVNQPERRLGVTSHSTPGTYLGTSSSGPDRQPHTHEGHVFVEMDDSSIYEGFFTGSYTREFIPEWMQPNGAHHAQHVIGFIRTDEYRQSQTSRLQFRDGPANHNVSQHRPTSSMLHLSHNQSYNVTRFDRYIPNREHRPPERLHFPLQGHFYVVVPGGHVYRGQLLRVNRRIE